MSERSGNRAADGREQDRPAPQTAVGSGREPIGDGDPEADFAGEHDQTSVSEHGEGDRGETESPRGHAGLEPTRRPN